MPDLPSLVAMSGAGNKKDPRHKLDGEAKKKYSNAVKLIFPCVVVISGAGMKRIIVINEKR